MGTTKNKRRLDVKKESLRTLSAADLKHVVGGDWVKRIESRYCPPTGE
ncbi:MAG TPA: hypothetical protein VIG06_12950 [Kofleriaceae bacterium]